MFLTLAPRTDLNNVEQGMLVTIKEMKIAITLVLFFIVSASNATEQRGDILLYKSDTLYIHRYPFEILMNKDLSISKRLGKTKCIVSDCWRLYVGIWKIENDSLFLVGLRDCCNRLIPLTKVFAKQAISNSKVFASWYSEEFDTGFGKILSFSEEKWETIFEKRMKLKIQKGKVLSILITRTE